jgi:hypothetical protein
MYAATLTCSWKKADLISMSNFANLTVSSRELGEYVFGGTLRCAGKQTPTEMEQLQLVVVPESDVARMGDSRHGKQEDLSGDGRRPEEQETQSTLSRALPLEWRSTGVRKNIVSQQ